MRVLESSVTLSAVSKKHRREILVRMIFASLALHAVLLLVGLGGAQELVKVPRIGFQLDAPMSAFPARIEGFRQGRRELGYIEGKNILIEWRWKSRHRRI